MLGVYSTRCSKVLHTYCITAPVGGDFLMRRLSESEGKERAIAVQFIDMFGKDASAAVEVK
ncbi:hypothetical protein QUA81_20375 [Microcoleus sp. F6_B4]